MTPDGESGRQAASSAQPAVRVRRVEGAPIAAVRIWLQGGSRAEAIPGQALLAGRLLAEGTPRRDWQRISEEAEARGCSIVTTAGHSVQAVAIDGLAGDWEQIVEWAVELTRDASFPQERFEWLRDQTSAELESLADLPEVVTGWAFLDQLYPDHPLGRPLQGTASGLATLTSQDCAAYHRSCLERGPLIAVAGEIDTERVSRRFEELLGDSVECPPSPFELADPGPPAESTRKVELPPGGQAHLYVGGLTAKRSDDDYEAARLLGVLLGSGSGLVGRIPHRIREVEGLSYGCHVESVAGAGVDRGHLAVSLSTSRVEASRALAVVREELESVRLEGASDDEIEAARSYLIGREPFRRETARQRALLDLEAMLLGVQSDDSGWVREQLEVVHPDDVRRAARKYLEPDRLIQTVGAPG